MGGWTVRLMWSLHFGFGCSLIKILTCCQHMLRYSVWILTKPPLCRPSLNRSQQRIIDVKWSRRKCRHSEIRIYSWYCTPSLWPVWLVFIYSYLILATGVICWYWSCWGSWAKWWKSKGHTKITLMCAWKVFSKWLSVAVICRCAETCA